MKTPQNTTSGSAASGDKLNSLRVNPNALVAEQNELTILLAHEVSNDVATINYQLATIQPMLATPINTNEVHNLIWEFSNGRVLDKANQEVIVKEVCLAINYKGYCKQIVIEAIDRLRADGTADVKAEADDNALKFMPTPPQFVQACKLVLGEAMRYVRQRQRKLSEFEALAKQADDDLRINVMDEQSERVLTLRQMRPKHIARLYHEIASKKDKLAADIKLAAWTQERTRQTYSDPALAFVMPSLERQAKLLQAGFAERQAEIKALEETLQWLENEPLAALPPPADDADDTQPQQRKSKGTNQRHPSPIRATDMPKVIRLLVDRIKVLTESERELVMAAASEPQALNDDQRNQLTSIARRVVL